MTRMIRFWRTRPAAQLSVLNSRKEETQELRPSKDLSSALLRDYFFFYTSHCVCNNHAEHSNHHTCLVRLPSVTREINTSLVILVTHTTDENVASICRTRTQTIRICFNETLLRSFCRCVRSGHEIAREARDFFGTEFFSDGSEIRYLQQQYPKSPSPSLPPPLQKMREIKPKKLSKSNI